MSTTSFTFKTGDSPIVAAAIHEGHNTREELAGLFNLNAQARLREEDPFTARWINFTDNSIEVHHSRFETDVNRPRNKAVYARPEDAWGLKVWKTELHETVFANSLQVYDSFYAAVKTYFDSLFEQHDKLVVYDIHSYNHRRDSPDEHAKPEENPEVNIGTKNMDALWQPLVQELMKNFREFDYAGRSLDVRENIKFKGGYFGQWLYEQYGRKICPISIEFKKFFMDEWTGEPFEDEIVRISQLLDQSKAPVLKMLHKINL